MCTVRATTLLGVLVAGGGASLFHNGVQVAVGHRGAGLVVEHVEGLCAGRGDAADLASHGFVLLGAARALGHHVGRFGLLDAAHLVALGDERVGEAAERDLGKATA